MTGRRAPLDGADWDRETSARRRSVGRTWRRHCDAVHRRLLEDWLGGPGVTRALKTDLYDEATAEGITGDIGRRAAVVHGLDLAPELARSVARSHPDLRCVRADVRALPYADGCFDRIVSNSTLDHFSDLVELRRSLQELRRVCANDAELVITLDNLDNPVVRLRARLPLPALRRLGLVPYFVGVTLSGDGLARELVAAGFTVRRRATRFHAPRIPAMVICRAVDAIGGARARERLLRLLAAAEGLERLRTRRWTGYYVAMLAVPSPP